MAAAYPSARRERIALRAALYRRVIEKAERTALQSALSLRCAGGQWTTYTPVHAGMQGGCTDDGAGCLCECHDQGA